MDTPITATQDDDEPSVLEEAFMEYRDAGLRLPPVPRELVDELDEFADWRWGSDDLMLENRDDFLARAADPTTEPEIGFGNVGHGVNSWYLVYRLIVPALAVFLRHPYGGAYGDSEADAAAANNSAEQLESLVVAAEAAKASGLIPQGSRLVVVLDSKGGSGWEVSGGAREWRDTQTPIEDALGFCGAA